MLYSPRMVLVKYIASYMERINLMNHYQHIISNNETNEFDVYENLIFSQEIKIFWLATRMSVKQPVHSLFYLTKITIKLAQIYAPISTLVISIKKIHKILSRKTNKLALILKKRDLLFSKIRGWHESGRLDIFRAKHEINIMKIYCCIFPLQ